MKLSKRTRFEQEALPHMSALYGMALKYTHHEAEAEDLVQDVMMKAYNSFDSFTDNTNCRAWLLRILANTFINKYRRKKREDAYLERVVTGELSGMEVSAVQPETVLEEAELSDNMVRKNYLYSFSDELLQAFDSISAEFKSIIYMADIQDFSYKEISEKLHIPIGTVMSRLSRGRQLLKKAFLACTC